MPGNDVKFEKRRKKRNAETEKPAAAPRPPHGADLRQLAQTMRGPCRSGMDRFAKRYGDSLKA